MFPIGDDDSQRRSFPVVTYALIGLNVLVFLLELGGGDQFIEKWAFIPSRFSADPFGQVATIFTAMFMHAGWLHLFGNMLYLWIFGDNVEDSFGHLQFLLFYVLVGIAATLAQYAMAPTFERAKLRGVGRDCRSSRSLHFDVSAGARESVAWHANRGHASHYRDWPLDCFTALQRNRNIRQHVRRGRGGLYGPHWRFSKWLFADFLVSECNRPPNVIRFTLGLERASSLRSTL